MKKILCIAAHPDDEILGCGATLARHSAEGDHVEVLIAAVGRGGETQALQAAAQKAGVNLGVKNVTFLGLPDNRLDSLDLIEIVKLLEEKISQLGPEVIYTHSASDLNIDHQILNRAVLTACRPQPGCTVKEIYAFEVQSATHWLPGSGLQFNPDYYVNVEAFMAKKISSLGFYVAEMRAFPHARSVEAVSAQATWRGSLAGFKAAEAFQILRLLKS